MLRMAASHQNKKMKDRRLNMRMAMIEQEMMELKIVMQELNGKKVVATVQLQAIPGSVRSATSGPKLQVIFANQRNVSHN